VRVMGAGEPVLVVDPSPNEELVGLLATRFRVIVADEPSSGTATLNELGIDRCAVIGVSSGAGTAIGLALEGRVDALVLVSPRDIPMSTPVFASWEFPVLVFGGEDDPLVSVTELEALHDAIPASSLGLLPGCGHDLLTEAGPTLVPMINEYLRARYLGAPHDHGGSEGVVLLQLEKRPPWADLAPYHEEDDEPHVPDPADQEVGPGA
jgi:pimeloyl-ACP methyl ester carboxylesterase